MSYMIDSESATPVYLQLAALLRARIQSGELQPNRPIPSEIHLEQQYGVARGTARKSIALLRSEGLVITIRGKGTYVTPIT
jgi:GntR family transcriptional regulator